jgi:peptidoglycan/LPS O-acetylase OafA/YrhL
MQRDRAVDVLRGLAIVLMITSHVGARSRVNTLLHLPLWIFALGLFVGLSGFVVGLRARTTQGTGARGYLRRAGQLWLVNCVLTLSVLAIHALTGRLSAPSISELGGAAMAMARE